MELTHYESGALFAISYLREKAAELDHELREHWKSNSPNAVHTHSQAVSFGDQPYVVTTRVEPYSVYSNRVAQESAK